MAVSAVGLTQSPADPSPTPADTQPCTNEAVSRIVTAIITVAPVVFLVVAVWQAWNEALHWYDLVVFAVTYIPIGLGVTIGFHRHLTHRSFKTSPVLRGVLAGLGSAAIEGPVISWVADHSATNPVAVSIAAPSCAAPASPPGVSRPSARCRSAACARPKPVRRRCRARRSPSARTSARIARSAAP